MTGLLDGVRVLDLTNVIAGPLCSYNLALLGAEVVKVEMPGSGDLARKMGAAPELGRAGMGVSFLAMNAGKRSMTLNLKSPAGCDVFLRLVDTADVVLENFRPGTMARLGLGAELLRQRNPRLIYCAVSGFGQTGPLAARASYDQIVQGFCGLMSLTGSTETAPLRAGYVVCDTAAALTAAFAVVAALFRRGRTGEGAELDVSMLDSALASMAAWPVVNWLNTGTEPLPLGNESHTAAPSGTFATADAPLNIVSNEQSQFERLCAAIAAPELLDDPRFADRDSRLRHRAALRTELERRLAGAGAAVWEERLAAAGVPVGPILSVAEAVAHPQVIARGVIHELDAPALGRRVRVPGAGFHIDGAAAVPASPPPLLGAETEQILRDLGCDAAEIAALAANGDI